MPTQAEVDRIADKLHAKGERVSLRRVIDGLKEGKGKGGSNREVSPLLLAWKTERDYKPRLLLRGLPEHLQTHFDGTVSKMWRDAQSEAMAALEVDRENMERRATANDEIRNEALERLDAAEAELETLRDKNRALTARLDRVRSEDFWERVMREIYTILPAEGSLGPDVILTRLKQSTRRGAALFPEPLTAATLRKKMDMRVSWGRYFVRDKTDPKVETFARGEYPVEKHG